MNTKLQSVMVKTTTSSPLSLIEQRTQLETDHELKSKKEAQQDSYTGDGVPTNCIFDIVVRLPIESLCTWRFVSKSWYEIVRSPYFINAHLRRSDTGIIFLTPNTKGLSNKTFSVESKAVSHDWTLFAQPRTFHIKFMEVKDGRSTIKDYNTTCTGSIKATCNGLVVLENPLKIGGGLTIINPVTREMEYIRLGTISSANMESYGLGYCHVTKKYKLVHLFTDRLYNNVVECEIMDIGSGSWRMVDGPHDVHFMFRSFSSVSVMGALHWLPDYGGNEYIVSITLNDEKFKKIALPRVYKDEKFEKIALARVYKDYNRILEMGEFLGFLSSTKEANRMDVWMLKGLDGRWEKQYSIDLSDIGLLHPLYCRRVNGELVFRGGRDDNVHAYDSRYGVMRKTGVMIKDLRCGYFPHVNSLVSWRRAS